MIKIIHIHTAPKFVRGTRRFDSEKFDNRAVVFLVKGLPISRGRYKDNDIYLKRNMKSIKYAIDLASERDIVVLHGLDAINSYIANRLPADIKIIWRFFGFEFYNRIRDDLISPLSKSVLGYKTKSRQSSLQNYITRLIRLLFTKSVWKINSEAEFVQAVRRVDRILGFISEEYEYLKSKWKELPVFIKMPFPRINFSYPGAKDSEMPLVVLGNSKSVYNNHLDLLEMISEKKTEDELMFHLLFNYGAENSYTAAVREKASGHPNIKLIEDFMTRDQFYLYYSRVTAFVSNSFRQMGLGNVFTALCSGVKIYLNNINPMFLWLKNEGFLIYTIEDFEKDLATDKIRLSSAEGYYNRDIFSKKGLEYSKERFHQVVADLISH